MWPDDLVASDAPLKVVGRITFGHVLSVVDTFRGLAGKGAASNAWRDEE
jgi:hypothetical protein